MIHGQRTTHKTHVRFITAVGIRLGYYESALMRKERIMGKVDKRNKFEREYIRSNQDPEIRL